MEKEIKVIKDSTDFEIFDDPEAEKKLDQVLENQNKIQRLVVLFFVLLFLIFIFCIFLL